jgi:hypothetical protein
VLVKNDAPWALKLIAAGLALAATPVEEPPGSIEAA